MFSYACKYTGFVSIDLPSFLENGENFNQKCLMQAKVSLQNRPTLLSLYRVGKRALKCTGTAEDWYVTYDLFLFEWISSVSRGENICIYLHTGTAQTLPNVSTQHTNCNYLHSNLAINKTKHTL